MRLILIQIFIVLILLLPAQIDVFACSSASGKQCQNCECPGTNLSTYQNLQTDDLSNLSKFVTKPSTSSHPNICLCKNCFGCCSAPSVPLDNNLTRAERSFYLPKASNSSQRESQFSLNSLNTNLIPSFHTYFKYRLEKLYLLTSVLLF